MTLADLITVLNKLGPNYNMDDAIDELRHNNVVVQVSHDHDTVLYDVIWEHAAIVELKRKNEEVKAAAKKLKGKARKTAENQAQHAGIFDIPFCTLYWLQEEYMDLSADTCPRLRLCVGRVGNTSMRNIIL